MMKLNEMKNIKLNYYELHHFISLYINVQRRYYLSDELQLVKK
jgi:hypothetical protein